MKRFLIAVDGLDGSGKETQTKLILKYFEAQGIPYRYLSFPTYDQDWSRLLKLYLDGRFGSDPESVNAYAASTFFACDRYCSFLTDWKQDYENGKVIICNRYISGNAVHQLSKLPEEEREAFLAWLFDYEVNKLGLPAPDVVLYLCLKPEIARKYISKRNAETGRTMDIHEKSLTHLENSYQAALYSCMKLGWNKIECGENDSMRSIEDIHEDIINIIRSKIK